MRESCHPTYCVLAIEFLFVKILSRWIFISALPPLSLTLFSFCSFGDLKYRHSIYCSLINSFQVSDVAAGEPARPLPSPNINENMALLRDARMLGDGSSPASRQSGLPRTPAGWPPTHFRPAALHLEMASALTGEASDPHADPMSDISPKSRPSFVTSDPCLHNGAFIPWSHTYLTPAQLMEFIKTLCF